MRSLVSGCLLLVIGILVIGYLGEIIDGNIGASRPAALPTKTTNAPAKPAARPTASKFSAADRMPPTSAIFSVTRYASALSKFTHGEVNLRDGPDTMYVVVAVAPSNSRLDVIGYIGDWYEISYDSRLVYVAISEMFDQPLSESSVREPTKVRAAPTAAPASSTRSSVNRFASPRRRYTHGQVNLRHGPGTSFDLAGSVSAGSTLDVIGQSGEWYVIRHNGGEVYIAGWLTFDAPLAQPVQQQPASGRQPPANTVQQPPANAGQQQPTNAKQEPPVNVEQQPLANAGAPECDTSQYKIGQRGYILCSSIPSHMKPIRRGHCLYNHLDDRDSDGIVCES